MEKFKTKYSPKTPDEMESIRSLLKATGYTRTSNAFWCEIWENELQIIILDRPDELND